jgi:hypothetical protein
MVTTTRREGKDRRLDPYIAARRRGGRRTDVHVLAHDPAWIWIPGDTRPERIMIATWSRDTQIPV